MAYDGRGSLWHMMMRQSMAYDGRGSLWHMMMRQSMAYDGGRGGAVARPVVLC